MTKQKLLTILTALIFIFTACSTPTAQATLDNKGSVQQASQQEETTDVAQDDESSTTTEKTAADEAEITRPEGWSEKTHGKSAEPDYAVVFAQDKVNRIDITIVAEDWQAMLEDMTTLYGEPGTQTGPGGRGRGQERPEGAPEGQFAPPDGQAPPEGTLPQDQFMPPEGEFPDQAPPEGIPPGQFALPDGAFPGQVLTNTQRLDGPPGGLVAGQVPTDTQRGGPMRGMPGGGGPGGIPGDDDVNPTWVPVTIEFEGETWTSVGLRFKGNSSLRSTWQSGNMKLPLRLNFDKFEDDVPEIDDQRFYGFQELAFSSNFSDASFLREKVTADIFREAGVAAPQTAFYEVYIDYGEGPIYFGLYTLTEIVEDTVIETQFEDDNGNVYKPSGSGATFAAGSFSEETFDKQTNEDDANWSDILSLFDALHDESRTTDPEVWRSGLEAVFDVDGFLNWLAVNTVVQNWDTYGSMSHNYYLYHDPTTDQLTWIPWDNNMALSETMGRQSIRSLSLEEVNDNWPLIRYLLDDEVYYAQYIAYVKAVINGAFEPALMEATYRELAELVAPYALSENTEHTTLKSKEAFSAAINALIEHAYARYNAASDFLVSQP